MSSKQSDVSGLYFLTWDAVYSETRRNPWNAVSMAAHSIVLSWKVIEEFHRFHPSCVSKEGVMGMRGGFLNRAPCVRLMPLITLYKRLRGVGSGS